MTNNISSLKKEQIEKSIEEIFIAQEIFTLTGTYKEVSLESRLAAREAIKYIKEFIKTAKKEASTKEGTDKVDDAFENLKFVFNSRYFEVAMESGRLFHAGEYKNSINLKIHYAKQIKNRLSFL